MNSDKIKKSLNDVDAIIANIRVLESGKATLESSKNMHEAAMILGTLMEEKHVKALPEVIPPTQETIIGFISETLEKINALREYTKEIALDKSNKLDESVVLLQCFTSFVKAEAFLRAYYNEIKSQYDQLEDYKKSLAEAKNVVIVINEDMKANMLQSYLKALWKDIWEKEVFIHEWNKNTVSDYMKATNIHYEDLHCKACFDKFDIEDTLFYTIGFNANDTLPVEFKENAFVIQM